MTQEKALFEYLLRKADDSLIIGHRLSEWCGHGPILEEDIALTNLALDLVGQATELYKYAAEVEGKDRDKDDLAFLRLEKDYKNILLVEQTNGDFGKTIVRQFFFGHFEHLLYTRLLDSKDERIAAIAAKSIKELTYHIKHTGEWMIRLGDGTEESHNRVQESVTDLVRFIDELFYQDEVDQTLVQASIIPDTSSFRKEFDANIKAVLDEATLSLPEKSWQLDGGRKGVHSEHLGYILTELQYVQRAYPGNKW